MIEALPSDGADDSLHISPLPRGSRRTKHLFDAHVLNLTGEVVAKDSISVLQQIAGCRGPRERIAKLLGGPFRGRMSSHVEVQNAPPLMRQYKEYVKHLESNCGHREEIDGDQLVDVVLQKGAPGLGRWFAMTDHVLANTGFADIDAQFK